MTFITEERNFKPSDERVAIDLCYASSSEGRIDSSKSRVEGDCECVSSQFLSDMADVLTTK